MNNNENSNKSIKLLNKLIPKNGYQDFQYPDGTYYQGFWENSKREGAGKHFDQKGGKAIYIGEWAEDLFHGEGILFNQNSVPDLLILKKIVVTPKNFDKVFETGLWERYEGEFF